MEIVRKMRKRRLKNNLIFISAGDQETFASFALVNLTENFDIAIFYYGCDDEKSAFFKKNARYFSRGKGSKFNALRKLVQNYPDWLKPYQSVWVCDDDMHLIKGNVHLLPKIVVNFGLSVASPAHALEGKNSHKIMLPVEGNHFFRYTNYVEMGFPIFRTAALIHFLKCYDGSLAGWGTDWWFLNVFNVNRVPTAAIVDSVVVMNPWDEQKPEKRREIDKVLSPGLRRKQWIEAKQKHNLMVWRHSNKFIVYAPPK